MSTEFSVLPTEDFELAFVSWSYHIVLQICTWRECSLPGDRIKTSPVFSADHVLDSQTLDAGTNQS